MEVPALTDAVLPWLRQADLVPETTGTVIAIKAEEGDTVRKGQVLAVIDNATLDAALARAEAEATKALAELDKIRSLHDQGVLSDRDLQDAEFAEAAALIVQVSEETDACLLLTVSPKDAANEGSSATTKTGGALHARAPTALARCPRPRCAPPRDAGRCFAQS